MLTLFTRARAEPKAWRLLNVLVHRIPVRAVTRYLNAHKFLEFFHEMLREAIQDYRDTVSNSDRVPKVGSDNDVPMPDVSDSSTTEMNGLSYTHPSQSRKRKRSNSDVDRQQNAYNPDNQLQESVYAAYQVLVTLVELSKGTEEYQHLVQEAYEKEYVKSVLRSEPATAADILGLSFDLVRTMLAASLRASAEGTSNHAELVTVTETAVQLWKYRSGLADDVEGTISHVGRFKPPFLPARILASIKLGRNSPYWVYREHLRRIA